LVSISLASVHRRITPGDCGNVSAFKREAVVHAMFVPALAEAQAYIR